MNQENTASVVEAAASADETQAEQDITQGTAAEGVEAQEEQQQQEERRFTQAELDAAIQKRLLKEERRIHRRLEAQLREQAEAAKAQKQPERDEFKDDDEYIRAQIDHMATARARQMIEQREREREIQERTEGFLSKAEQAQEKYPDFESVVGNPRLPINESMAEFMALSAQGAEIAYHLGKNPTKAAEIARMSPVRAALELQKLEATFVDKPRRTPPPEPISPLGNRGRSSTSALPSDDDDIDTWMRKEQQRLKAR